MGGDSTISDPSAEPSLFYFAYIARTLRPLRSKSLPLFSTVYPLLFTVCFPVKPLTPVQISKTLINTGDFSRKKFA
jgi:hypothetical protein